jgi:ABC-type transport system involved in cytochrome c biogenesis ATPase subunit
MVLQQDREYVVNEMRAPKPESVEINEWISHQKAIKEEIAWTEEIEVLFFLENQRGNQ